MPRPKMSQLCVVETAPLLNKNNVAATMQFAAIKTALFVCAISVSGFNIGRQRLTQYIDKCEN